MGVVIGNGRGRGGTVCPAGLANVSRVGDEVSSLSFEIGEDDFDMLSEDINMVMLYLR